MSEIEDIKKNITLVQGPQGQTVVLVPPKREVTDQEVDMTFSHCCLVINIMLGSAFFILGAIGGNWFLAIAAIFVGISVFIYRNRGRMRRTRRSRFMYKDDSGTQRIPTTVTEEDND